MSKSTNCLPVEQANAYPYETAGINLLSTAKSRVSLSAGTTSRLSARGNKARNKNSQNDDWHDDVLQTASVLHEQIARIARVIYAIDGSSVVAMDDDVAIGRASTADSMAPSDRNKYSEDLHEILLKVCVALGVISLYL